MATQVQFRGGTTAQNNAFTGASKELTVDTDKDVVVVHDGATAGGHPLMAEDGSNSALASGTAGTPALKFDGTSTGIYSPGADQLAISTSGTERVEFGTSEVVFNDNGENYDFRIEGDTKANLFFVDASTDRVGFGTSSPSSLLHVQTGNFGSVQIGADGPSQYAAKIFNPISTLKLESTASDLIFTSARHFIFQDETGAQLGRWASDGKLGIGTTSPSATLEVIGGDAKIGESSSYQVRIAASASTGVIEYPTASSRSVIRTLGATPLEFEINSSPVARIDSAGRLLVGTSSESGGSLLQVNDDRIRIASSKTPASASDTGTAGEICWDSSYIYVCTATDTWKRAALSTW